MRYGTTSKSTLCAIRLGTGRLVLALVGGPECEGRLAQAGRLRPEPSRSGPRLHRFLSEAAPDGAGGVDSAGLGHRRWPPSRPQVLAGERRRRAPAADGSFLNASDRVARWYGVHSRPPQAPGDQGDGGEDGCRGCGPRTVVSGRRGPRASRRWFNAAVPDDQIPGLQRGLRRGGSDRASISPATVIEWGQPVSPPPVSRPGLVSRPAAAFGRRRGGWQVASTAARLLARGWTARPQSVGPATRPHDLSRGL